MKIRDALRDAERRLGAAGVDTPRVDAELLLAHVAGTTRSGLYADLDRDVDGAVEPLLRRREAREPLAYILGEWGFRRLTLKTDARALVPRPETEIVVERCLGLLAEVPSPRILDVGVGSGAIALALKDERPDARVVGVDVSAEALSLARENAAALDLDVELREGDIASAGDGWDLVVSNPPYVDTLQGLQPELGFEPTAGHRRRRPSRADRTGRERALRRLRGRRRPGAGRRARARCVRLRSRDDHARPRGHRTRRRGAAMTDAAEALRAGEPVILPTDTVYGLCGGAYSSGPTERLYALKGRDPLQPSALLAADLETLFECVPELRGRAGTIAQALLPGPYTLILPNPARRFRWITGATPDAIGVRVPDLPAEAERVITHVGCIVATSANLAGGPDPCRVDEIPQEILDAVGAVVDAGELPGTPSTVLDFTADEPRVVREGAAPAAAALERVARALA